MSTESELDEEIIREFLLESQENLDQLDQDLVALEQSPESRELLASIFRTIHTIKGTSGFLAFGRLERLTHSGESLLSRLRDGVATMTPQAADVLLRMVDLVRLILAHVERDSTEGDIDVDPTVAAINAVIEGATAAAVDVETEPAVTPEMEAEPTVALEADAAPDAVAIAALMEPAPVAAQSSELSCAPEAAPVAEQVPGTDVAETRPSEASIRVDVELLEQLVRLAGELVLARNQIVQRAVTLNDEPLSRACRRLNLVAGGLQEGVMRTRMQPIENVWAKLPRVVRDLSSQLGRKVRLELEGGDTELDRTLLEAVKDPLTHLVRNAIDHGIESPEQRVAAGKQATGVLHLRAAHEGGQVLVEITDNGRGIDPVAVGNKAVANGVITATQREEMSDADLQRLVFLPGFSTASAVTNVSGRGVGLDVVTNNIERIGGSIDVESTPGVGTAWRLRIPLTLAIVPALTVLCAGQRYAIPQVNLLELVRLDEDRRNGGLEEIGDAQVYRLRDTLLPVVRLADILGLSDTDQEVGQPVIVVLEADGRRFGLVVDRVLDTEEIVVKPISGALKEIGYYAGATVLGDGRVTLIIDVQGLARRCIRANEAAQQVIHASSEDAAIDDGRQLLVVEIGGGRRVAIPLEVVTRLEEFPAESIERVGHREVVRHRNTVLPLIRLSDYLGSGTSSPEGAQSLPGVVYSARGRSVALLVNSIVDIVSASSAIASDIDDIGLVGSAVLHDRVTELLDVRAAILAADPAFYTSTDLDDVGSESATAITDQYSEAGQ
jgi:two-component system, chemotaxis family, sensor kinase CheA